MNIIKSTKKISERKHVKDIKIFLEKKQTKGIKDPTKTSILYRRTKRKEASVLSGTQ